MQFACGHLAGRRARRYGSVRKARQAAIPRQVKRRRNPSCKGLRQCRRSAHSNHMTGNGNHIQPRSAHFEVARREMVERQIRSRGISSERTLDVMAAVPRHLFVPPEHVHLAYADEPVPIGAWQTISQPYMVAVMTDALALEGRECVLEVGAGSGYQAAVLASLSREVIAVEADASLASQARDRLAQLGYSNVHVEADDGSLGWPVRAPYDAILVAAAAPAVPRPLIDQLKDEGRLVIPVGTPSSQDLIRIVKRGGRTVERSLGACRFVPLRGRYGWRPDAWETPRG